MAVEVVLADIDLLSLVNRLGAVLQQNLLQQLQWVLDTLSLWAQVAQAADITPLGVTGQLVFLVL